jgi:hypothetical protein
MPKLPTPKAQDVIAVTLSFVMYFFPLAEDFIAWPYAFIASLITVALVLRALRDGPIVLPVLVAFFYAGIFLHVSHHSIGSFATIISAIVLGEMLALNRSARYHTPGRADTLPLSHFMKTPAIHGGITAAIIAITLALAELTKGHVDALPRAAAVIVAFILLVIVVQRQRRSNTPHQPPRTT